jgi:hypothetical protein
MRTLPGALIAAVGAVLLVYMLLALPSEAATIHAIEIELALHRQCLAGDAASCAARMLAEDSLRLHVLAAADKVVTVGPCLYAGDEGVALRCDDVVLDVAGRAARILQPQA